MYRIRPWWWDENIISKVVVHTVKYDNLKKVYLIKTGEEEASYNVSDYQEMKKLVMALDAVPIDFGEAGPGSAEEKYYLQVMGAMPSFDSSFFWGIFSSNEFSTPWIESREFSLSGGSLPETLPEGGSPKSSNSPVKNGEHLQTGQEKAPDP